MKVYELMSKLSEIDAGMDVSVGVSLSLSELQSGDAIEEGVYALELKIDDIDWLTGYISVSVN